MPTRSFPAGRLAPPLTTMGLGKEMRKVPCTPRDSKTMCRTALRCRCRPTGPGGTCWVQAGSGCLAARVTRSRGGSVWASPNLSRDGMGTTTWRATCPAAVLASLPVPPERPERRSLTAHTAGLARRPSTTGACGLVATGAFGGLGVLLGQSGPGLVLALGVVPNIRRPRDERDLQMWGSVQGTN